MRGLPSLLAALYIVAAVLGPTPALADARRTRVAHRASPHRTTPRAATVRPRQPVAAVARGRLVLPDDPAALTTDDAPSRPLRTTGPTHAPGFNRVVRIADAPNARHPEVLVHAPAGFDPRGPLHVVVFLHGWLGCIDVVSQRVDAPCRRNRPSRHAADIIAQFDRARVNAMLLVPQLAYDVRSSSPGRLAEPGAFRRILTEVLAHPDLAPLLGGPRAIGDVADVVLAAHSGAYLAAANILDHGDVDVRQVLLLDALYQREGYFERWAREHLGEFERGPAARRLFVVFTAPSGTGWRCRALVRRIASAMPDALRRDATYLRAEADERDDAAYGHPLVSVGTRVLHRAVPRTFLSPLLASAGLPGLRDIPVAPAAALTSDARAGDAPDARPVVAVP